MLRLDWNLVFTVINLIVLYLLMRKFLIGPVNQIMAKRKEIIEGEKAEAEAAKADALSMKEAYEENLKNANQTAAAVMEKAKTEASVEYDRIVKNADEQASKKIEDAKRIIDMERQKTLLDLQSQVAGLAMEAADKIIRENSSSANDALLYDQFIGKTGDSDDTAGN